MAMAPYALREVQAERLDVENRSGCKPSTPGESNNRGINYPTSEKPYMAGLFPVFLPLFVPDIHLC